MIARQRGREGRIATPDPLPAPAPIPAGEDLAPKREARRILGNISNSTFDRGVDSGWIPPPIYVTPRVKRWVPSELRAAAAAHRMTPRQAKELRRQARIAATEIGTAR
jgi:predicted DNA-binding transcriptional regulator AlpA